MNEGKSADFLVLSENPMDNLRKLSNPGMVVFRGDVISKPDIKRIKEVDDVLDSIVL